MAPPELWAAYVKIRFWCLTKPRCAVIRWLQPRPRLWKLRLFQAPEVEPQDEPHLNLSHNPNPVPRLRLRPCGRDRLPGEMFLNSDVGNPTPGNTTLEVGTCEAFFPIVTPRWAQVQNSEGISVGVYDTLNPNTVNNWIDKKRETRGWIVEVLEQVQKGSYWVTGVGGRSFLTSPRILSAMQS